MNDCDQTLFNQIDTIDEEQYLGGFYSPFSSFLMPNLGGESGENSIESGDGSNGVSVQFNLAAVLISGFVGRLFGLRGNALSWYMLMNSVRLRRF